MFRTESKWQIEIPIGVYMSDLYQIEMEWITRPKGCWQTEHWDGVPIAMQVQIAMPTPNPIDKGNREKQIGRN